MNGIAQRQTSRFATFILPALLLAGCFGTGEGPEPIAGTPAPPPEPTPDFCFESITFEDVCGDFDFIDPNSGEPGFEGGVTLVIDNPDVGGLNTSEKVAQMQKFRADSGLTFGGSTLQRPDGVDFSSGETVRMLVWASRPVPVLFKFDGLAEERFADHSGSGEWEELCFDFTGATPGELAATTITFIFDLENLGDAADNPNDWTFYFDDITLGEEACGGGGGGAQVGLPVTFDDAAVDYDLVDFGDPVPAATTLVADPTDAANTVASTNKPVGTPVWAGTTVGGTNGLAAAIPFTATETTMTVRVYSPDAGIPVRLKVEDAADPNISVETEVLTSVANEWETLAFDFSVQAPGTAALDLANTYDKVSIFFNFGTDGDTAGDKTYLWDDVEFVGPGAGGDAPVVAAPTPTQDEANVISLYSDAYVDSVAEIWPTPWSAPNNTTSDVTIDGGLTKEHLNVDFIGVEFASLDVSGMTHFHMDIWSPNIETLLVKLVDFGGDGFGGGNDTEGPIVFDGAAGNQPAPAQGQWVSLDISLADMQAAGLASLTDINQLVFSATPTGSTTIYVDNVYFYNGNAGGGAGAGITPDFVLFGTSAPADVPIPDFVPDVSGPQTFGSGASFNFEFADTSFDPVIAVTAGDGYGPGIWVAFIAVNGYANPIAAGYDTFNVKVKGSPDGRVEVKLIGNGDDSVALVDVATYAGSTDLGDGWYQLEIPLAEFTFQGNIDGHTGWLVGPPGDQGDAAFDFLLTDVGFSNVGGGGGGGGDGTFVNGDFETGDLTGWTPVTIPDGVGSITLDSSGQGGRAGTVARLQAAGSVASGNDVLLSQVALGAGTIQAGDTIDVSFDLFGSLAGAGGVVFVEVIFLDANGDDVGGRDFVGPAAPYTPTNAWTTHSGTVIAGTATGGAQFDVSGGVTLQLKAACGPIDGCGVDAYFDNVTFTINGGGQ